MNGLGLLILVILSNMLISGSFAPLGYISIAVFHEIGHLLAIKGVGKQAKDIRFVGFGIQIKKEDILSYKEEIIVALAGPAANLLAGAILLVPLIISDAKWLLNFFAANLFYAVLNLLPLPPLDGYKIVSGAIHIHFAYYKAHAVMRLITGATISVLLIFSICLMLLKIYNFSLILILVLLIFNASISLFSQ